jgi:hypothetical protein
VSSLPASTPTSSPRRLAAALLVAAGAVAACSDGSPVVAPEGATSTSVASDVTSSTAPAATTTVTAVAPTTTTAPQWVVGASPLPLRADGFGEVLPTPEVLVRRSLATVDVLPPPASGGFESSVSPISPEVRARMGGTLQEGCPVGEADLRHLTLSFVGFDGRPHTGELVVHRDVADDVVGVFAQLFAAGFPIEELRLVTDADLAAPPTGDGNVTASFVCRAVRGGTRFSAHASGLAIDVNPFMNPYQRDDLVLPELASAYLDRSDLRPGMIVDGDVVVTAFEAIGWTWGGRWDDPVDTMHFSATGG